ncbi:uncharacterized protein LOC135085503 [Ostrinia nubilalis]
MWKPAHEARLREHCARLKAETVSLRATHQPRLFSYHDIDEEDIQKSTTGAFSMAEMEAAVMMQEMLAAREARTSSNPHSHHSHHSHHDHPDYKSEPPRSRRRDRARRRARASETAL